jgi:hypothetical protein
MSNIKRATRPGMDTRSWIKECNILHYHMEGHGVMIGERNVERVLLEVKGKRG